MTSFRTVCIVLTFSSLFLSMMVVSFCFQAGRLGNLITWLHKAENWEDVENGFSVHTPAVSQNALGAVPGGFEINEFKANLVRFYLYTDSTTRYYPDELLYDDLASLRSSRFNRNYPVKIFIHGFGHRANCSFPQEIKDIYLAYRHKVNIIAVDWGDLSMDSSQPDPVIALKNYKVAVEHVPIVGKRVGQMISFLYQNQATFLGKVHIVGFSLGAHVAGYAGEHVYRAWLDRVSRITGLDPAGPLFLTGEIGRHLNENDAEFVDFIHTDMGQCGTVKSMGHANFFVNSGFPPQPGCLGNALRSGDFISAIPLVLFGSCSHNTAPLYYGQSIIQDDFALSARRCFGYMTYRTGLCVFRSSAVMGERCEPGTSGDYYLDLQPMTSSGLYRC